MPRKTKHPLSADVRDSIAKQTTMLSHPFQLRTPYYAWSKHRNRVKKFHVVECQSLLDQLVIGAKGNAPAISGRVTPVHESKQPTLDHLDVLTMIDKESRELLIGYGIEPRKHLKMRLPQVGSTAILSADHEDSLCDVNLLCQLHYIEKYVNRWFTTAINTIGLDVKNISKEPA